MFSPNASGAPPPRRAGSASYLQLAIGLALLVLGLVPVAAPARDFGAFPASQWTATNPPINLAHIDTGEINHHGEAVGYHHRYQGIDPAGARVLRIIQPPDANGVYRARVAVRNPATGEWIDKRASSTFYPDAMSDDEVVASILSALHNGRRRGNGEFIGDSGRGFMIEGWYQSGRIVAAYPLRGP